MIPFHFGQFDAEKRLPEKRGETALIERGEKRAFFSTAARLPQNFPSAAGTLDLSLFIAEMVGADAEHP